MSAMAQRQEYTEEITVTPAALSGVRLSVSHYLKDVQLTAVSDEVLLVITELLSNVFKHVSDKSAELRLIPQDSSLQIRVSDHSCEVPHAREPSWDSENGRGMFFISQIDPSWQSVVTRYGKTVICAIPLRQREGF